MSRLNLYSIYSSSAHDHINVWFDLENNSFFNRQTMMDIEDFINKSESGIGAVCGFGFIGGAPNTHPFFKWVKSLKFISMNIQTCNRLVLLLNHVRQLDLRYVDLRFSDMIITCMCDTIIHMTNNFRVGFSHSKSLIV